MRPLSLFNTLTHTEEQFTTHTPGKVGMYTCGPTVYDEATIGNYRTYIFADVLLRTLIENGYDVRAVQNITDVGHLLGDRDLGEDKLELQAKKIGKQATEIAAEFAEHYFAGRKSLELYEPTIWAYATKHIPEQISLIETLEQKGFTYNTSDGVYFDTSKLSDYGVLAGLDIEHLQEGARIEPNPEKKNPTDFALWKFSPKDATRHMEWQSPWGVGFPGWHIECSAMSLKYLGDNFDIHTGGVDFIPLHHTNEIAQNEAATGTPGARFWIHGEFLTVDGGRMGKSLGNAYTLADLTKHGFTALDFKYLTYSAHYRQKLNFTWESLSAAAQARKRLTARIRKLAQESGEASGSVISSWHDSFMDTINDDLNVPAGLAVLWQMLKSSNENPADVYATAQKMDRVLGLRLGMADAPSTEIPTQVQKLLDERMRAREERNWERADELRQEILAAGYSLKDTGQGQEIEPLFPVE